MEETFTNNYKYLQTFVVVCKWTGSNKQVELNRFQRQPFMTANNSLS